MKIGIIGGGVTGTYLAILLSQKYPNFKITLFEKNEKINKKIYVTGNGRCNLGNKNIKPYSYSNRSFSKPILDKYNLDLQRKWLSSLGIETYEDDNGLIYPISESAKQVGAILQDDLISKNVKILRNCRVFRYLAEKNQVKIFTEKDEFLFDKVIFCAGAKSSSKFGSDGNLINEFKNHKYNFIDYKPGLTPIKIKEIVKEIDGVRVEAVVSILQNNKLIHKEQGEVLFKKDGLSGIVIFNCSSIIARLKDQKNIKIILDIVSPLKVNFQSLLTKNIELLNNPFDSFYVPQLSNYLKKLLKISYFKKDQVSDITKKLLNLEFNFKELYSFDNSQVSVGGISTKDLNNDLSSKIEKNVYFAGEMVDVDGLCGGFNLMWCLASAMNIADKIK